MEEKTVLTLNLNLGTVLNVLYCNVPPKFVYFVCTMERLKADAS